MLKTGKISMVVLRLIARLSEECGTLNEEEALSIFSKDVNHIWAYNVPKVIIPVKLRTLASDRLIYFTGVMAGDGCLSSDRNYICISDGHPDKSELFHSYKYLCFLKEIATETFRLSLPKKAIKKEKRNYYKLHFTNKIICRFLRYFLNVPAGVKYSELNEPKILQLLSPEKRKRKEALYWRGYADTDGYISRNKADIRIGGKNKKFMLRLMKFLKNMGIEPSFYPTRTQYVVTVHFYDLLNYAQLIGCSHPRKSKYIVRTLRKTPNKKICFGLIRENLTSEGHFNLLKIKTGNPSDLKICGAGHILKEIRNQLGMTQEQVRKKFGTSAGIVSFWEQNKRSMPFKILFALSKDAGINIYHRLEKGKRIGWKVCNSSNGIKLPLTPDSVLNEIVNHLSPIFSKRPYAKTVYIARRFGAHRENKGEFEKILMKIKEMFGLEIKHSIARNNYYVHNRTLHRFLLTFYDYRPPWTAININTGENLLRKWEFK